MSDQQTLAETLGNLLRERRLMLTLAESCTGGGVAEAVTAVAGSSEWFDCGFVTYSNISKVEMLGVRPETLELHGAVSEATVKEMVEGALRRSHAQVALAVSGIAGPGGGSPIKPVGTVWLAWGGVKWPTRAIQAHFDGDREAIRQQAVAVALRGMLDLVSDGA